MKKSNILLILAIFIIPVAIYYFINNSSGDNISHARPQKNTPKLMQFTSQMCYDCGRVEKEIAPLRQEYSNRVVFQKIDVSNRTSAIDEMIRKYSVTVVPTLLFCDKNGFIKYRTEGYIPRSQIRKYLDGISNG